MDEKENVGFEDFESALFGDDYQFDDDGDSEPVETDDTEDGDLMDDESNDSDLDDSDLEDDSDDEDSEDEEADTKDPDQTETTEEIAEEEKTETTDSGQTFTLKVNKEEKQVTLEEMTALAQKGADYDRVKENYTKSQQTIQDLQAKLDEGNKHQGVMDILDIVASKSNMTLEELAESLYYGVRASAGISAETAKEELKSAKLEKELNGIKAQKETAKQEEDTAATRAQRELDAFKENYPDVALTDELISKLNDDLKKGVSLSAAYRNYERSQSEAKIKNLEQQLAAKKQNDKNKNRSPGSQKDSGGRRSRSDYEEFEKALFG